MPKNFYEFVRPEKILWESKEFFIVEDNFPVSKGHMLVVFEDTPALTTWHTATFRLQHRQQN